MFSSAAISSNDLGGGGVVLAQAVGEVGVDAPVLLLVGDRQRDHLALGKVVETAHRRTPVSSRKNGRCPAATAPGRATKARFEPV